MSPREPIDRPHVHLLTERNEQVDFGVSSASKQGLEQVARGEVQIVIAMPDLVP